MKGGRTMNLYTAEQMREADRRAREDMERLRAYLKQQEKEGT